MSFYDNNSHASINKRANDDLMEIKRNHQKMYFNFLLRRTRNYSQHSPTLNRIETIIKSGLFLPTLPDEKLEELYMKTNSLYAKQQRSKYGYETGFDTSPKEQEFRRILERVISENREFSCVKIYPSMIQNHKKLCIGPFNPDFILMGISSKGFSATIIELDGESHSSKIKKDFYYYEKMRSLGIDVISIPNDKAGDYFYLKNVLSTHTPHRSKKQKAQELRCWRSIWCYTLSYHLDILTLQEWLDTEGFKSNLVAHLSRISELSNCPREIKREAKANNLTNRRAA